MRMPPDCPFCVAPAWFPCRLLEFFIRFLTEPDDTVLGIFAGSHTTGEVAKREGKQWLAFEERIDYVATSAFQFLNSDDDLQEVFDRITREETVFFSNRQRRLVP